jgi:hypothetical protein
MNRPAAAAGRAVRLPALSARLRAVLCAALVSSCSPVMLDDDTGDARRVYANDKAPNDSLSRGIVRDGVRFVLQPGKAYELKVATARASDILDVYSLQGGRRKAFKRIAAGHDGAYETFSLVSPLASATFFTARLLTGVETPAAGDIRGVALESPAEVPADTLRVKLLFMQTLKGLPSETAKAEFATAFFAEMNRILARHSIAVAGVTESVNPASPPLVFPFSNLYVPLAGKRAAGYAHLYLVDSISVGDKDSGPEGEVLGFAAREVVDLSDHRESRVILAKSRRAGMERLAVTAVHELGHFFGLRHTVSTRHDMLQDDDDSNVEDGFADTRFCLISQAARKAAADAYARPAGGGGATAGRGPIACGCWRIRAPIPPATSGTSCTRWNATA